MTSEKQGYCAVWMECNLGWLKEYSKKCFIVKNL